MATTTTTISGGKISSVLIVGAGPSGLLLGILLARLKIRTTILEQAHALDNNPRAAHYAGPAVREFRRAGVYDDVAAKGFKPDGVCWRNMDTSFIAGFRATEEEREKDQDAMVCLPLDKLDEVLFEHFLSEGGVVKWDAKVVGIEEGEKGGRVKVTMDGEGEGEAKGEKWLEADYVIGADGANSTIRKRLFGDSFPGETLTSQIVATNVYYDFTKFKYWDSQFTVHPSDWYMAAKITPDGMWRVTYGDTPGLTNEEYLARQPMRYEQILPGAPKPGDYKLVNCSPYKLHQRCAERFRVGSFLLVADAAHLCNPFGGMGLTGGFADVTGLYESLLAIHTGKTDSSVLDKYSEVRRKKWAEIIDPISRANFRRLWAEDAKEERENFFEMCKKMEANEDLKQRSKTFLDVLYEDMSPCFRKPEEVANGVNGH